MFILKFWPKCLERTERHFLWFYFELLPTVIDTALNMTGVDSEYLPSHGQRSCLGAAFPVVSLFWILEKYSASYGKNHSTVLGGLSLQIYP